MSLQGIPPAAGLNYTFTETANTNEIRNRQISIGSSFLNFQYSYIDDPLVLQNSNGEKEPLIDYLSSFDLRSGILLTEKLNMSFNISINSIKPIASANKLALGDSVFQLKYRVTPNGSKYQMALIPELYLPIGSQDDQLSTGTIGGAFRLAVTRKFNSFRASTNIGYRHLPHATWRTLDYSKHIIAGISSEFFIKENFSLNAEAIGFFSTPYKSRNSPGEIYLGGLWEFSPLKTLSAGVSVPAINDKENDSLRFIAGLKMYFDEKKQTPITSKKPECAIEPYNTIFHSRPLSKAEKKELAGSLPYLATKEKSTFIKTLAYGEMTNTTPQGIPYVENAQIPFAIDIGQLPPKEKIKRIDHIRLKLNVHKISKDKYVGTELLCSLDFKTCSGNPIMVKSWQKILNPQVHMANKNFGDILLKKPLAKIEGNNLYATMITFPLQKLLENSRHKLEDLLYSPTGKNKEALYFAVADDTYLTNDVRLEVSLGVEKCR